MECQKVPGLFFIGEVVDVTGHLGGFNFQWAWASGAAAARPCPVKVQSVGRTLLSAAFDVGVVFRFCLRLTGDTLSVS